MAYHIKLLFFFIVILIGFTACQDADKENSNTEGLQGVTDYLVLTDENIPGIKRSVVVAIERKMSEVELRAIAIKIKEQEKQHFPRTFIDYYLFVTNTRIGAWATTHFDPDLKVEILGLTDAEEKTMAESSVAGRNTIGRWLDESPFVGGVITIFNQDDTLYMERKFKDGSVFSGEMIEGQRAGKRTFHIIDSPSGDYYVLKASGDLEIRDQDGWIATARKL